MDGRSGTEQGPAAGRVNRGLAHYLPLLVSLRGYSGGLFARDLLAAVIVTIMLIPQSLAYALLAGLPPEMGLYASIVPLLAYALFGTSRTLSVGPVAVISLMTATAVGGVAASGTADYATAAIALALLSGAMLVGLGLAGFGFLANFLSHPVVSGFITASGVLIGLSQLRHLMGIDAHGETLPALLASLSGHIADTNLVTLLVGSSALLVLVWSRRYLAGALARLGLGSRNAEMLAKAQFEVLTERFQNRDWMRGQIGTWREEVETAGDLAPVSYTHLTLPTIQL